MAFHRRCDACGKSGPTIDATYRQNTGMLIMRQSKTWEARFCRSCSIGACGRMSLHTFFLGWWGTISFFVTPIFLLGNLYYGVRTLLLPTVETASRAALEDQREYAVNLLKTKDDATVIEVLAKDTGVDEAEVAAFVARLRAELVQAA